MTVSELEALANYSGIKMNKALAEAGVSRSTYWRWKQGKTTPFQSTLETLAKTIKAMARD